MGGKGPSAILRFFFLLPWNTDASQVCQAIENDFNLQYWMELGAFLKLTRTGVLKQVGWNLDTTPTPGKSDL